MSEREYVTEVDPALTSSPYPQAQHEAGQQFHAAALTEPDPEAEAG